ncbi:recombinase RecB [Nostoc sp. ATCC 43529]|nr:recombinase RecB [Nostoc sp. ATCC 43529]
MLAGAALRKTGSGWEFASEAALEDFVWDNLQQLSGLIPLKRQYAVKGEICDILALNETRQLVILELKNTEDRYIVQQLTRYYDNLLDEKPFSEQIDYSLPVRLVAIAPSFHRHNLIDRKHTKLIVDFLQVTVAQINQNFHLQLQDIDTNQIWSIPIPYQELDISTVSSNISEPPQLLLDWLGACTGEEQQAILKLREKILSFDERIQEEIQRRNTIRYGKGKNKPVAELCFQKKTNKPVIFLWLPTPSSLLFTQKRQVIGRMRLWMDGAVVTYAGHIPEGFGRMRLQSEWDAMPREQRPRNLYWSLSYKSFSPVGINTYKELIPNPDSLESLVDLALSKWSART